MTKPGDIGLLRPVGNERIFVPARRPVVGEKCLLYPILGGGRYAIPLDQVAPGDRYLLEPSTGGRIAVPLVTGCVPMTPVGQPVTTLWSNYLYGCGPILFGGEVYMLRDPGTYSNRFLQILSGGAWHTVPGSPDLYHRLIWCECGGNLVLSKSWGTVYLFNGASFTPIGNLPLDEAYHIYCLNGTLYAFGYNDYAAIATYSGGAWSVVQTFADAGLGSKIQVSVQVGDGFYFMVDDWQNDVARLYSWTPGSAPVYLGDSPEEYPDQLVMLNGVLHVFCDAAIYRWTDTAGFENVTPAGYGDGWVTVTPCLNGALLIHETERFGYNNPGGGGGSYSASPVIEYYNGSTITTILTYPTTVLEGGTFDGYLFGESPVALTVEGDLAYVLVQRGNTDAYMQVYRIKECPAMKG